MNTAHIAAIASGTILVTAVLAVLLRENGSYSTNALLVLGGLAVAFIGLILMAIGRSV